MHNPAHLYPLYCLLFTMPGVPSLYYGSEWGLPGRRSRSSDRALRPCLDLPQLASQAPHPELLQAIKRLARIRHSSAALRYGRYQPLHTAHVQFAFLRHWHDQHVVLMLNASDRPAEVQLDLPLPHGTSLVDLLDPRATFTAHSGKLTATIPPCWARILQAHTSSLP
ncbi:MAG: alpha-glucosidase C-terminal domain-containing protein [Chloroflexota bacterium]|nr:alpha-glucosidase C-terminal domain-containing protein [Chloroflexota bacterium]